MKRMLVRLLPWAAALGSGALLRGAYAPFDEADAAWFALVPLMIAVRFATPRRAFGLGLASGLVFWLTSLAWLWRLTDNGGPWPLVVFGHICLSLYCALYTGAFGALVAGLWPVNAADDSAWRDLRRAVLATLAWVGLELVRSTFLTGFAWNHLGVSQVTNRGIVQVASLGGVYAVSALVLLLNAVVANVSVRIWRSARGQKAPRRHWDLMATLALVVASFFWGRREMRRIARLEAVGPTLMVAAVQPDAPSIFERDDASALAHAQRLADRTERVAAFHPDVIVWPETVLLGVIPRDRDTMDFAFEIARRSGAPLLAGAVEVEELPGQRCVVANASWLFEPDGSVSGRYRKQHLVPFGEFIPLDKWFPVLEKLSPIGYSCTAGTNSALMRVAMRGGLSGQRDRVETPPPASGETESLRAKYRADPEAVLSPLICFEDTVSALARRAVMAGATVLVNQSNDAWFDGSSEGRQHHAQAVFRAIENRVPVVRCANAGVSAVIDATGRSSDPSDFFAMSITPRGADWPMAPYTRWGDWLFGWPCVGVVAVLTVRARRRRTTTSGV